MDSHCTDNEHRSGSRKKWSGLQKQETLKISITVTKIKYL